MKKWIVAIFVMSFASYAVACDVCGCSVSGGTWGVLPQFKKHFVGIRSQVRSFTSTHLPLGNNPGYSSSELFNTVEVWGRFVPHKRVQLFAQLPMQFNQKSENGQQTALFGVGDASVLASYIVYKSDDSAETKFKHLVQLGGGVKLPTGRYDMRLQNVLVEENLQPGTGSFDFPFLAMYTFRYRKIGINAELSYRINTANPDGFKYGNQFISALRFFTWHQKNKHQFLPQFFVQFDQTPVNRRGGVVQELSGGYAVQAGVGFDYYHPKFVLGIQANRPVYQHYAQGQLAQNFRIQLQCLYLF